MTGTSGDWAPLFPVFRSTDLVNWSEVGAVFPAAPPGTTGKFWAPAIAALHGRFLVYYSAARRGGPPCVSVARAPAATGPYRNVGLVACQPTGSIDPAVSRDAGGHRYLVWKQKGAGQGVWGAPLTPSGTRLAAAAVRLTLPNAAWEQGVTEGPDIVFHAGRYYLFYAGGHCCRPPCTYAEGVARSKNILGPYVKAPANPLLRSGNGWKCPGHGSLVSSPGGLYLVHHAYPEDDPFDLGRETLLDPVAWGDDGWPAIGAGGVPVATAAAPLGVAQAPPRPFVDRFTAPALAPGWEWPLAAPPRVRLAASTVRVGLGTISRATTSRNFIAIARPRPEGLLSVLTARGPIGVRATRSRGVEVIDGGRVVASLPLQALDVRLDVRDASAIAAYARAARGPWRPVGPLLRGDVDRVALGPGTFADVSVRALP